ncbi:MAG: iron export ABC transporter permease subunit FetB [Desulfobacterales bacterium]|jgi:putative ABC transport system permease protein
MIQSLPWLTRILGALLLVGVAALIANRQKTGLEKDMLTAVIRAFVQLIAIGYVLEFVFAAQGPFWILLVVAVMVTIAGSTAGRRGTGVPRSVLVATTAISCSAFFTVGTLLVLQVFPYQPRYIIPIAGMIVGNSMVVCGLVMARLRDDIKLQKPQIEAALALGATPRQAVGGQLRRALVSAMTPIVDNTKTVGLISLPGAMTGMILAGASVLEAVQVQIIVMYMLIGASAISGLTTAYLTYRRFFTRAHQLDLGD